jgi:hypothetical protein
MYFLVPLREYESISSTHLLSKEWIDEEISPLWKQKLMSREAPHWRGVECRCGEEWSVEVEKRRIYIKEDLY